MIWIQSVFVVVEDGKSRTKKVKVGRSKIWCFNSDFCMFQTGPCYLNNGFAKFE